MLYGLSGTGRLLINMNKHFCYGRPTELDKYKFNSMEYRKAEVRVVQLRVVEMAKQATLNEQFWREFSESHYG